MTREPANDLRCEVACVLPEWQEVLAVTLPAGSKLGDAVQAARALLGARAPERAGSIDWEAAVVGVWGRVRSRSDVLTDGDRVELYRPLPLDPKERRRERARAALRQQESGRRQGR